MEQEWKEFPNHESTKSDLQIVTDTMREQYRHNVGLEGAHDSDETIVKHFEAMNKQEETEFSGVVKPKHYDVCGMTAIDVIKHLLTDEEFKGFIVGNVLKYRLRAGKKGETLKDIAKANEYERIYEEMGYGK